MANLELPRWPDDTSHVLDGINPDGILGGLPAPAASGGSIHMLLDHDPPDIGDAPYTVSNGVAHKVAMPIFGHVTGPAINGPNAKRPSDSALGFDPAGAPQWRAALMHPLDAIKGKELSVEASNLTKSLYPGEP